MQAPSVQSLILDADAIEKKINRLAYQIWERNHQSDALVFAGIASQGYFLATQLAKVFSSVSGKKSEVLQIRLDKKAKALPEVHIDGETDWNGKTIIVVDDVLNTGRTLAYAIHPFLQYPIESLQVAILVDRNYNTFPIKADFVGYSLSTTLEEHVEAVLNPDSPIGVYLH